MSLLHKISHSKGQEEMIKSILVGALQHLPPPRPLQDGAMQALDQSGANKDPPLVGTARPLETVVIAGMMDLTTVTPGATATTKTTGPIRGLMHLCLSLCRAGMEILMKAGVTMERLRDQEPATTGVIPPKVPALWAGTATVTAQALGVGVSPVGPTPAAVIHGSGVEDQTPQTRAPPILAPTGPKHSTSLILRVIIKAGANQ